MARRSSSIDVRKPRRSTSRLVSGHPRPNESVPIEPHFKKAMALVKLGDWSQALPLLKEYLRKGSDKQAYLSAAKCCVGLSDRNAALNFLNPCLKKFPKFVEAYHMRASLMNKEKKWDKAVPDLVRAIELSPRNPDLYISLAESYSQMGNHQKALHTLKKAITYKPKESLVRRGALYYTLKNYEKALSDLNESLSISNSAEANYYKALVLFAQENLEEAALCLEQSIKYDPDKKLTGAALYNLAAIRIKQCDFYGALCTFQRAQGLEVPEQFELRLYVEGVLSLMKRQFAEAADQFTIIIKKKNSTLKEYIGKCLTCRAFAFACLKNHERAMEDIEKASQIEPIDVASEYNLCISKGVVTKDPALFEKANILFPNNTEPFIFQSALHFLNENYSESMFMLEKAERIRKEDSDLSFYKGVLKFKLEKYSEAIQDVEQAIDRAEDNDVTHYLLKGMCHAALHDYREAIQDFSNALKIDENSEEALKYRGKCYFLSENTQLAFTDFQKLLNLNSDDPSIHILTGDLLLLSGNTQQALQAYKNANQVSETSLGYVLMASVHLLLNDLTNTWKNLKKARKICKDLESDYRYFKILVNAHNKQDIKGSLLKAINNLKSLLSSEATGSLFSTSHVHWMLGVMYFYLGQFSKAKKEFGLVEDEDLEIYYNMALCSTMAHCYEDALIELHKCVVNCESKDRGRILLLMGVLQLGMGNTEEAKELITEGFKHDPDTVESYLDEETDAKILPLKATSVFAATFPMAKVRIGECRPVLIRPSFALPKVDLPHLSIAANVEDMFDLKKIKCKPEPPWLNRVKGNIQFTEQIYDVTHESENSDEEKKVEPSGKHTVKKKRCKSANDLPDTKQDDISDSGTSSDDSINPFKF